MNTEAQTLVILHPPSFILSVAVPDELRLAYAVGLSAIVFICSLRFARRVVGGDWIESLLDGLLISFVVQYVSVCIPGLLGVLDVWSISVTAVLAAGVLGAVARDLSAARAASLQRPLDWPAVALCLFVTCYLVAILWEQRLLPPVANDALTYHLPAAVQWLQDRRLGLFETWFHDPANTYSPLAGSVLATWWLAPLGNDVLARFVQAPALLLLLVAMIQIIRAFGVSTSVAALIATGAVTSRPFISQALLAKDDLLVAAFFAVKVASLTRVKLGDGLGPWRVGMALGLLLATKYTALLSLPLLLLAVDAPIRAGWKLRNWFIAALIAIVLAGPWYLRNAIVTGNPLFPIELPGLHGLFWAHRSPQLASLESIGKVLVTGYYSTTIPVAIALAAFWALALGLSMRSLLRTPLVRLCLLGPPIGIGLFLFLSPYPEIRFIYPSLVLLFACGGIVAYRARSEALGLIIGVIMFVVGVSSGFVPEGLLRLLPAAVVCSGILVALMWRVSKLELERARRAVAISSLVVVVLLGGLVYVSYSAFLRRNENSYANECVEAWKTSGYGTVADAWEFVRTEVPPAATIAYTNTSYIYPLYGFDLKRRAVYVPTRRNVTTLADLPHFDAALRGDRIVAEVSGATTEDADRAAWMSKLSDSAARYLLVVKPAYGPAPNAPELAFAVEDSTRFTHLFENEAAVVYRIESEPATTRPQ